MSAQPGHDRGVRRLAGAAELLALTAPGGYARAEVQPGRVDSCWAGPGDALGWVVPSRRVPGAAHLVGLGEPREAAGLLRALLERHGLQIGSVTLPRDADRHLGPAYRLAPRNDWEWFVTTTEPPQQPREGTVRWLREDAVDDIGRLLETWSGRHHAMPGDEGVLRWAGVREQDGRLVAVAAHTEHRRGIPHLASVATHGDVRGQGYGGAVTAWLTRRLLAEGAECVTLGMYSDNDVARRLYARLGYRVAEHFTSGRLVRAAAPGG
jgi:RimJ/RimL family protein N-acetyltransferase